MHYADDHPIDPRLFSKLEIGSRDVCRVDHGSGALGHRATEVCAREITPKLPQLAPHTKFRTLKSRVPSCSTYGSDAAANELLQEVLPAPSGAAVLNHLCDEVDRCFHLACFALGKYGSYRQNMIYNTPVPHMSSSIRFEQSCSLSAQSELSPMRLPQSLTRAGHLSEVRRVDGDNKVRMMPERFSTCAPSRSSSGRTCVSTTRTNGT